MNPNPFSDPTFGVPYDRPADANVAEVAEYSDDDDHPGDTFAAWWEATFG